MERSPLGKLSPELRNRIYELVLYQRRPVAISRHVPTEPPLLQTCKQIREEADLLFYTVNDFSCMIVGLQCYNHDSLKQWLSTGPPRKLALIKSLTIRVELPWTDMTGELGLKDGGEGVVATFGKLSVSRMLHAVSFGGRPTEKVVNFVVDGETDDVPWQDLWYVDEWKAKLSEMAAFWMHRAAWGDKGCPLGSSLGPFIIFAGNQEKLRHSRHGGEYDSDVYGRRADEFKRSQQDTGDGVDIAMVNTIQDLQQLKEANPDSEDED